MRHEARTHLTRTGVVLVAVLLLVAGLIPGLVGPFALRASAGDDEPFVTKTVWVSDHHVEIWVHSPAMGSDVPVHLLLARDWYADPSRSFPQVYLLDGMKAADDNNGWIKNTDVANFYADKDINVVAPVGGEASFYSDWLEGDNGKTYKWETFLVHELPGILEHDWRSNDQRAVVGSSMGGTGAMTLAARNPGFFRVVASFSGILQTTSLGMPQAIDQAMKDSGGYDSTKMWGDPTNPEWAAHDPYSLAEKLRGSSLYISSGNGVGAVPAAASMDSPEAAAGVSGSALELLSRLSSQSFAAKLTQLGIPAQAVYRPSGTHSWPYWQFENTQLWPQLAMGLGEQKEQAACAAGGEIGDYASAHPELDTCLTAEFDVASGKEQDFKGGRVLWSSSRGAHAVLGAIGGEYAAQGGPDGPLGLPLSDELAAQDGDGRYQLFANGAVYWQPDETAHAVRGDIFKAWTQAGAESGAMGYPTGSEHPTPGGAGVVQSFENGLWYWSSPSGAHPVAGAIQGKYASVGYEQSPLGFPVSDELAIRDDGRVQRFSGGNAYWQPNLGASVVLAGPIMDVWATSGYENGPYGYPVGDAAAVENGVRQDFEHATVESANGQPPKISSR